MGTALNGHSKPKRGPFEYTNPFKGRVFTYLRMYPNLSFAEYKKRANDKQTLEWVFDAVKSDIRVFGEWNGKEIVPKEEFMPKQSPFKQDQPEPAPVPEAQLEIPVASTANQIALPPPVDKRQRLDPDLKKLANELITAKPSITFDELQEQMHWPELDKQNFFTLRYRLQQDGIIPKREGRVVSPDTKVCRQNLNRLSFNTLTGMNHASYEGKYSHVVPAHVFRSVRMSILKDKAPANVEPEVKPVAQMITAWESMAELDLSEFDHKEHPKVRKLFQSYFEKRRPEVMAQGKIKLSVLMDPPTLEIRRAVTITR